MRSYRIAGLVAGLAVAGPACAGAPDWTGIDWLVGQWTAEGGGAQQGAGGFSFSKDAGGQVLVRRNFAEYPAQNGKPRERHEDLMVVYLDGSTPRAVYWDSEGHTIHYGVTASGPDEVDFVSDDVSGPRYRLTYRRTQEGLQGRFEIAPPNARDRFATYLTWTAHRAR